MAKVNDLTGYIKELQQHIEKLEGQKIDLLAVNKILIQQRDKAQQQRDDLLEACEVLIKHPECLSCRITVEKAIAKAK